MRNTGWQAATYLLAGIVVLVSAAAWNNARTVDVLTAELRNARSSAATTEAPCDVPATLPAVRAVTYAPNLELSEVPGADGRCINGQRFAKRGNEWLHLGAC